MSEDSYNFEGFGQGNKKQHYMPKENDDHSSKKRSHSDKSCGRDKEREKKDKEKRRRRERSPSTENSDKNLEKLMSKINKKN